MNALTNVTVQQVSSRPVNTKFGPKPTFSFKADDQWFKTGFKRHNLNVGDVVSFSYEEDSYGNQVDPAGITKGATSVGTPAGGGRAGAAPGSPSAAKSSPTYSSKGIFPIPALDGQRSIVRQNALTNARELAVALTSSEFYDPTASIYDYDKLTDRIISIARKFEAYTAGDLDAAEVQAEMDAEAA